MADTKIVGLDRLNRKIENFARQAPLVDRKTVIKVAVESKAILLAAAEQDAHGRRLSRFANGRGVTLNVTFNVRERDGRTSALIQPVPPGPWYLLEKGSAGPFQIGGKRRSRRSSRSGRAFLGNPATGFAAMAPVTHPQVKAHRTWSHGMASAVARGGQSFRSAAARSYLDLLRG